MERLSQHPDNFDKDLRDLSLAETAGRVVQLQLVDVGVIDSFPALMMENAGIDLHTWLQKTCLEQRRGCGYDFAMQLLQGLRHMHSHKIIHCDLSSKNVLLRQVASNIAGKNALERSKREEVQDRS